MRQNRPRSKTEVSTGSVSDPNPTYQHQPKKSRISHNNKVPPDAPRRNLSSFVMFANFRRCELKREESEPSYPELQRRISKEWKNMSDDDKERWRKAMEADKERYKREMDLYRKYGPGWVWVVGHRMRQELGLDNEDCTALNWSSAAGDTIISQRDDETSLPQSQPKTRQSSQLNVKKGRYRDLDNDASSFELVENVFALSREKSRDDQSSFLDHPASLLDPAMETIDGHQDDPGYLWETNYSPRWTCREDADDDCEIEEGLPKDGQQSQCPRTDRGQYLDDEYLYHLQDTEIISPSVFDTFGIEMP